MDAVSIRALHESVLTDALANEVPKFVRKFCSKRKWADPEDVSEGAVVGAFNAWDRYNPNSKPLTNWDVWLAQHIYWQTMKAVRPTLRKFRDSPWEVSLSDKRFSLEINQAESESDTWGEVQKDPESQKEFEGVELETVMDYLSPTHRYVLLQRFVGELDHKEIAELLKVSVTYSSYLEEEALSQLRSLLADEEGVTQNAFA